MLIAVQIHLNEYRCNHVETILIGRTILMVYQPVRLFTKRIHP